MHFRIPRSAAVVAVVALATVAAYLALAWGRTSELGNTRAADAYYNRLADGFRAGHLHLSGEVPPGLAQLPDPYDPVANAEFRGYLYGGPNRVHDLSYRDGRLHLYFGVTPAILLFLPWAAVTGGHLWHAQAVAIFAVSGFLLGAWLLADAWRRFFRAAGIVPLAAAIAAFGLGSGFPIVLNRPDVWEVPIACGFSLAMASLAALWRSLLSPARRAAWLAASSLCFGLALGARPSLLPGALLLLVPVLWRPGEAGPAAGTWLPRPRLLAAALLPAFAVGIGLLVYNHLRFGSPFEFGQQYQLAGDRQDRGHFSAAHLWFNLRAYFLAPAGLSGDFPFVRDIAPIARPAGYGSVEPAYGMFANMPFTLLALALPLALRRRVLPGPTGPLAAALVVFLLPVALLLCLFYGVSPRYQAEITPLVSLIAGLVTLAMACGSDRRVARFFRHAGVALAAVSVTFNVLAAAKYRSEIDAGHGLALLHERRDAEAVERLEASLRLSPGRTATRVDLAMALFLSGRAPEGSARLAEAISRAPGDAPAIHRAYGPLLLQLERLEDVDRVLEAAIRAEPDAPGFHNDRGTVLAQLGRTGQAALAFQEALRLDPDSADVLTNLGVLALQSGRPAEARTFIERALAVDPGHANARQVLQRLP